MGSGSQHARIGVVIVNHNTPLLASVAVESVLADDAEFKARTMVVNVGCSSTGRYAQEQSVLEVMDIEENVGFGAANNAAIAALGDECSSLLLLNSDASIAPGCMGALHGALMRCDRVGAAGPKILWPSGELQYSCARKRISLTTEMVTMMGEVWPSAARAARALVCYPRGAYERPFYPRYLSGACFLIRREAWLQAGGFDERYFMYGEDIQLFSDLRRRGWFLVYEPSARCTHVGGASSTGFGYPSPTERASMLLFFSNEGATRALAFRFLLGLEAGMLLGKALVRGRRNLGLAGDLARIALGPARGPALSRGG